MQDLEFGHATFNGWKRAAVSGIVRAEVTFMKMLMVLCVVLVSGAKADLAGRVGVRACDELVLDLPSGTPEAFTVDLDGRHLHLSRFSSRAPDFQAWAEIDGRLVAVETPVRTYRGTIDDDPATFVAAMLYEGTLEAWIVDADGTIREIVPDPASEAHALFDRADRIDEGFLCGTEDLPPVRPDARVAPRGDDCLRLARIAYDCDYKAYQHFNFGNGSVDLMVSRVEQSQSVVDMIYARDVLVTFEISAVIVRTEQPDPYPGPNSGDLLEQLRVEFLNNQTAIEYDVAHLISATCCADGILGLAWVGVVCTDLRFGISRTLDPVVICHEVGHNFGAPHCLEPVACDIMCGGGPTSCATFSPATMNVMLAHRDSRTCLDPVGPYATPLPPVTRDDHTVTDGPIRIDVLGNDYDANCEVSLFTFDPVSANGATIERSVGTGPDGRDEILYTPAGPGSDAFDYLAGDLGGATFGHVTVEVIDTTPVLVAHYPLDETGGPVLQDTGAYDGLFEGTPLYGQSGVAGTSVGFDADQDQAGVA
ncbi:MAG: hypothetical protein KDA28_06870, partial [Phycisphaerales bacterium]|nr:hypothetical protein [Phycisphaerales bacterium]